MVAIRRQFWAPIQRLKIPGDFHKPKLDEGRQAWLVVFASDVGAVDYIRGLVAENKHHGKSGAAGRNPIVGLVLGYFFRSSL